MTQLTSSPPARSRSLLGLRGLRRFNEVSGYSVLMVLAALFMIPLYWMFSTAVKSPQQTFAIPPEWIPAPAQWSNFREVFDEVPFGRFYLNTLFLAGANIVGHLVSVTLVAYGFARLRFPGRNFLFLVMLSTLMIPYQVTLVPRFVMFAKLGMINSYWPLILPAFTGTPFLIFLVRQYMMSIPFDLDEAAYIDGATRFDVFWRIIIPLARPALMLVVVFTFIDVWNDFLQPLIYLNDPQMFTVSLGLSFFQGARETNWNLLMAGSVLAMIPPLILFFFAQKQLIGGISVEGLKG
ncbi:MAG: carbohydrate ABC transporter permease [Chloroflexota bacterium]|jgi:multiple sugar transport system permease protein|nr:carbohydrate ABC transporter permease [Anaerolineae bacterium]